jgi:hypothetical protein
MFGCRTSFLFFAVSLPDFAGAPKTGGKKSVNRKWLIKPSIRKTRLIKLQMACRVEARSVSVI